MSGRFGKLAIDAAAKRGRDVPELEPMLGRGKPKMPKRPPKNTSRPSKTRADIYKKLAGRSDPLYHSGWSETDLRHYIGDAQIDLRPGKVAERTGEGSRARNRMDVYQVVAHGKVVGELRRSGPGDFEFVGPRGQKTSFRGPLRNFQTWVRQEQRTR
jgi:hypothetical protein